MSIRASLALSAALIAACGGGGGGAAPDATAVAAAPTPGPSPAPATQEPPQVDPPAAAPAAPAPPPATVQGTDFNDRLEGPGTPATLYGGRGDDVYVIRRAGEEVVEYENEGIDTVETWVPFTLPDHVENLRAVFTNLEGGATLTGNSLDNYIVGAPFTYDRIFGLEGDDILDGGGRHGGYLSGGPGNDRLIVSFGELLGGPGADIFVAGGRGAHTAPDVPIHILDFTPAEGDRIEIAHVHSDLTVAGLFEHGYLRFDPAQNTLTLYADPTTPQSVQQVFVLAGVTSFEPAWVTLTGAAPQP